MCLVIQENFTGSGIMVGSEASSTFLSFSEAPGIYYVTRQYSELEYHVINALGYELE